MIIEIKSRKDIIDELLDEMNDVGYLSEELLEVLTDFSNSSE